ncbi:MAG: spore coat protein [Candidatus Tectimicrobiota bacterium]|nr:MAG: spore coat protein [Candidatus Tectomicrobia bacterium]
MSADGCQAEGTTEVAPQGKCAGMPLVRAFVQARMSSQRFPGKVLAPFRGRPLIWHVVSAVQQALPAVPLVVVTSEAASDDPLVAYVQSLGLEVFRGPLANVFARFRACLARYPCAWILRVSGDSPLLDGRVLRRVVHTALHTPCDVATTVFPRTFPSGHNAEMIRAATFLRLDQAALTAEEQEHVTLHFYRHAERFRLVNVASGNPALARLHLAVDTLDDLRRLETSAPFDLAEYEALVG